MGPVPGVLSRYGWLLYGGRGRGGVGIEGGAMIWAGDRLHDHTTITAASGATIEGRPIAVTYTEPGTMEASAMDEIKPCMIEQMMARSMDAQSACSCGDLIEGQHDGYSGTWVFHCCTCGDRAEAVRLLDALAAFMRSGDTPRSTPQRRSTDKEASPERLQMVEVQERLGGLERLMERVMMDMIAAQEVVALIREGVGDE